MTDTETRLTLTIEDRGDTTIVHRRGKLVSGHT
jgi:hypothetical protein